MTNDGVGNGMEVFLRFINDFILVYKPTLSHIKFVPEGCIKASGKKKTIIGLLHDVSDWQVMYDLGSTLIVPSYLTIMQLRPDILIVSNSTRSVIVFELTCPCEENMEAWHTKKVDKYLSLCVAMRSFGWSVKFFAFEVGARGFCSQSVHFCLRQLGFTNKLSRSTIKALSLTVMKCSFCIWLARDTR